MPNPMHYDSDHDFYNDCMSPEDRIVQALTDREDTNLVHDYVDWVLIAKPGTAEDLLIDSDEAYDALQAFAKARLESRREDNAQANVHQLGLDE